MIPDQEDPISDDDAEENQESKPSAEESAVEDSDSDFIPWDESSFKQMPGSKLGHRTIVKSTLVAQDERKVIVPSLPEDHGDHDEDVEVTPIMEGEQITGIKVDCPCGRIHEISFEFES